MKFSKEMLWFEPMESFTWTADSGDNSARQYGDRKVEMTRFGYGFLCGLLRHKHPKKVLEVGVAAGGTTCILLKAMQLAGMEVEMHSIDLAINYYANVNYQVGYMVEQCFDPKPPYWNLHTGRVAGAVMDSIGGGIDFCILDTAHFLPGEVLDFLTVLPYLQDGAVVVLHDVNLHLLQEGHDHGCATKIVMDYAEGEKIYPVDDSNICSLPNIAAIIINEQTRKYVHKMFSALYLSWSYMPSEQAVQDTIQCIEQHYTLEEVGLCKNAFNIHSISRQQRPPFPSALLQKNGERACYGAPYSPQGMNICYAADENFVQHMGVSLCSLLINAYDTDCVNIFLFANYISSENLSKILQLLEIKQFALEILFVDSTIFADAYISGHVNEISYYRLIIAELLPQSISKALYIDCDTIVLQSLHALYATDVSTVTLGAVRDYVENTLAYALLYNYDIYKDCYFNAGVLLMNVRALREQCLLAKAKEFMNKFSIINFWDQDVLNALIPQDQVLFLDFSYNFQSCGTGGGWDNRAKLTSDFRDDWNPCIFHYITAAKPWKNEVLHVMVDPMVQKYYFYLGFTPWKSFTPENGFYLQKGISITVFSLVEPSLEEAVFDKLMQVQPCHSISVYSRHDRTVKDDVHIDRYCVNDPLQEAQRIAAQIESGIILVLLPWGREQALFEQAKQSLTYAQVSSFAIDHADEIVLLHKKNINLNPFVNCDKLPILRGGPYSQSIPVRAYISKALRTPHNILKRIRSRINLMQEKKYIERTKMFDATYYLGMNNDVLAVKKDPLLHYMECGAFEGRKPNAWFDTHYYARNNPDVVQSGVNPFYHYLKFGAAESRKFKY